MTAADRAIVESVAGELLAELGYELEGLGRPLPAARRAWWQASGVGRSLLRRTTERRPTIRDGVLMARAELLGRLRSAI